MTNTWPALIQEYSYDRERGLVTLTMPHVDETIALSVLLEMKALKEENKHPTRIDCDFKDGAVTIEVQSLDHSMLAINVAKIMNHRLDHLSMPEAINAKYATTQDTVSLLESIAEQARAENKSNAAIAIDSVIGVTKQIKEL